MRGLVTAGPWFVVELPQSTIQHRLIRLIVLSRILLTVTVPPALLCIGCGLFRYSSPLESSGLVHASAKLGRISSKLIDANQLGGEFLSTP